MGIKPSKISIFNQFDEFGVLAGLSHWTDDGKTLEYVRYPGETNKQLKDRILKANKYRGNSTLQGMLNNINRDLSISISGNYNFPIYNTETKNIFYLSEPPYPSASGIRVYVSTSGSWNTADEIFPQVRASGYASATSGWIVWNTPDYDPSLIPSGLNIVSSGSIEYGNYTQILEFIGSSIPATDSKIRIDYEVQTEIDTLGQPVLNTRTDFSNPDDINDIRFIGKYTEFPETSGTYDTFKDSNISIFTLDKLSHASISGIFYQENGKPTAKLIEIANMVNEEYPLYWNKFRYDIGRWDQLEEASVGSIPSFHDELSPSGYAIKGGSKYGIDLDCVELVDVVSGNIRSPWYPSLVPGEFYIGNECFYLFGNMQYQTLTLVDIGNGILSGILTGSDDDMPYRLGTIAAYTSGVFFDEVSGNLPNSPYFKRLHDFSNVVSGVFYRTPYVKYSYDVLPSGINFNGSNFYYDYKSKSVYASGVNPTGFVVVWEHPGVYTSGTLVVFSGGYQFDTYDFNPLSDPFDKVFYFN